MSASAPVHSLTWFEIPVRDLDRAQAFYQLVSGQPLRRETIGTSTIAVFAKAQNGVGGCLFSAPDAPAPSTDGTVVYLIASPTLDAALGRVERAGGKVLVPPTDLPAGMGRFAQFLDCEGNRVGLHAMQ